MSDCRFFEGELSKNKTCLALLFITLFGAILRVYKIDFQSLWLDELYTIIPTDPNQSISSLIDYCKGDQPPLFFLYCQQMFKLFGYNEVVGRLSSALLGVLAIPSIFLLAREFSGRLTSLFAALLLSINYFHIYYSQELRFYTLLFLLTTISYLFFVRAFKNPRLTNFIGYSIVTSGLLYTHYFGLLIFVIQAITFATLLFFTRMSRRFVVSGIASSIMVTISFVPWIPIFIKDLGIRSFWIKSPDPYFIITYFYYYFGKDILSTIILVLLFSFFIFNVLKSNPPVPKTNPLIFILIVWFLLSYLVPYLKSITSTPILHHRYTMISLPVWFIFFALGWDSIKKSNYKMVGIAILFLSSICNLLFFKKHYSKVQKEQFREVSQLALEKNIEGYPLYSTMNRLFNFYFRESNYSIEPLDYIEIKNEKTFWLLQATPVEGENDKETQELMRNFDVLEKYEFYKGNLILFSSKSNDNSMP